MDGAFRHGIGGSNLFMRPHMLARMRYGRFHLMFFDLRRSFYPCPRM